MSRFGITFEPVIAWPWIVGLAAALAVIVALLAWQRVRGSGFRAVASALLVLALCNPVLQQEERERLPSVVALVVDESASQGLGGRRAQTEAVVAALKERISALGEFELREIRAGGEPGADGTALFSELTRSLEDLPPDQVGGAVMVTDGIVHDVPEDPASLGISAPVHALVTGTEDERDRRVVIEKAPRFAILDEPQTISFRVLDTGLAPGSQVIVRLKVDGREVATDRVGVGELRTLDLPLTHAGKTIAEVAVDPVENELSTENNVAVAEVDVVRERLRVLLVSGEPHSGERTWRDILKSDAAVDLVHFTILRPPEKQDGTPINELSLIAFPTRELFAEKIDQFDLIIFDRYQRRGVLPIMYYDNLARYVRDGGAILVAAGPDYASNSSLYQTPLGSILPAVPTGQLYEQPYRATISTVGARHPVTRDLPGSNQDPPAWSQWFRLVDTDVIAGDVTMEGPGGRPLLVLAHEDKGRVATLLSDHAWLWARGYDGGGPHAQLLRRLVHWLMKEPELEEEALTAHAEGRRLIVERQTLSESRPTVRLTDPLGETTTAAMTEEKPGLWRTVVENAPIGLHRAEDGGLTALAHVGPANPREFQDVLSTTERLAPVAEATRGSAARVATRGGDIDVPRVVSVSARAPAAGDGWIGFRRSEASVLKSIDRLPLLGGLLGLALLVGGFGALWYREGR
ncbi:hypothetical protein [Propylenella binzhouense]|uniref:Glutamine amidotransferase domain-containing protein n=1 Tax=Propylenella binzhouense TaxID=2555902 RepID=A0A964T1M7_9HYPH|nr:hypothetical protein [Propylenella binzhouense]